MVMSILTLLGALGMFLWGMNTLSTSLQKSAGESLRRIISRITGNPVKGVLTGLGVTSVIQSSSATTVMVVGFANAGLLTLAQAISVIMGANIGTTMTAWIISIFGFKADISTLAIPLMALGFILSISKKDKRKNIGDFVIGFSMLFLGLSLMKNSVPDLSENPEILSFISGWANHGYLSVLIFLVFGTVLTLILQSSSATVALTLIMLNLGWIPFEMACAMVLGENIGTTITANIAAAVGSANAKRAALAHTFFNVFGVMWALAVFFPFVKFISYLTSLITSDPNTSLLYGISLLHTIFNLTTTCILIWFIPVIQKLVTKLIKDKKSDENNDLPQLKNLDAGLISTPELALSEADKQIVSFAKTMKGALEYIQKGISLSNDKEAFVPYREKLVYFEDVSDKLEFEIVSFLNHLDKNGLSEKSTKHVQSLIRIVGEMESLGDSGETISRTIMQKNNYGRKLSADHLQKLNQMSILLSEAYNAMITNLEQGSEIKDISNAKSAEREINVFRNNCREAELLAMESGTDSYFSGVFFLSIMEEMEKMGDFMINISQSAVGKKEMDVYV